ncbi:MAG: TatD family hydrolase [Parcubacteria group bacterium]
MKPKFIDSHAHVQFADYDADREEVIKKALAAGVWMINSGSDLSNSAGAVELAEKYEEGVYATVGIHPSESAKLHGREDWQRSLRMLAENPKCVAVGECGLEYFSDTDNKGEQKELFIKQMEISDEVKKPLVIHCRDAYDDLYGILKENENLLLANRPALMHFFSGMERDAERFLDMGFVFSFGGATTFSSRRAGGEAGSSKPNKTNFGPLIKKLPLSAILLETDCPYVTPEPYRGKRNEPSFVTYVAMKMAEIKGVSVEKLAEATTENALKFFAIDGASR